MLKIIILRGLRDFRGYAEHELFK